MPAQYSKAKLAFRPSLAWQLTFKGVSKVIIFSSLPLRALSSISSFLYSPENHS